MRRAARTDNNQTEIVDALRERGASVEILAAIGKGCPDLLVGYCGVNLLVEVKDGDKAPSARPLTPDQIDWHRSWEGQVETVINKREALELLQEIEERI